MQEAVYENHKLANDPVDRRARFTDFRFSGFSQSLKKHAEAVHKILTLLAVSWYPTIRTTWVFENNVLQTYPALKNELAENIENDIIMSYIICKLTQVE